jgi:hypothetical protein
MADGAGSDRSGHGWVPFYSASWRRISASTATASPTRAISGLTSSSTRRSAWAAHNGRSREPRRIVLPYWRQVFRDSLQAGGQSAGHGALLDLGAAGGQEQTLRVTQNFGEHAAGAQRQQEAACRITGDADQHFGKCPDRHFLDQELGRHGLHLAGGGGEVRLIHNVERHQTRLHSCAPARRL